MSSVPADPPRCGEPAQAVTGTIQQGVPSILQRLRQRQTAGLNQRLGSYLERWRALVGIVLYVYSIWDRGYASEAARSVGAALEDEIDFAVGTSRFSPTRFQRPDTLLCPLSGDAAAHGRKTARIPLKKFS